MSEVLHKKCLYCRKPFDTTIRSRIYCSQKCSAAARKGISFQSSGRRASEIVKIRLTKPLPVFPEFQLTVGRVYTAEKYAGCSGANTTYIVTRDEKHRTIVRLHECEEVADEQDCCQTKPGL